MLRNCKKSGAIAENAGVLCGISGEQPNRNSECSHCEGFDK